MTTDDRIKVFSFDIFDTTLTRCLARPQDLFFLMQRTLQGAGYGDFPQALIKNFYRLRPRAELKARLRKCLNRFPEIMISEIYEELRRQFPLSAQQVHRLIDLELSTESRTIYPIAWTVLEIESLRKQDKRIIFTSDMYLPLRFVEEMLLKARVYRPQADRIYLSSEIGLQKFTGGLFRHILAEEKCQPQELCHFGDDWYADVAIPARLGITLYQMTPQQIKKSLQYYYLKKISHFFTRICR